MTSSQTGIPDYIRNSKCKENGTDKYFRRIFNFKSNDTRYKAIEVTRYSLLAHANQYWQQYE